MDIYIIEVLLLQFRMPAAHAAVMTRSADDLLSWAQEDESADRADPSYAGIHRLPMQQLKRATCAIHKDCCTADSGSIPSMSWNQSFQVS